MIFGPNLEALKSQSEMVQDLENALAAAWLEFGS
jgi:hypothetical protein